MSRFFPRPEDSQEEPLAPIFERNKSYKTVKDLSRKYFLQTHYPKTGFFASIQNLFGGNNFVLVGGFATSIIVVGLVAAFIFNNQAGKVSPMDIFNGIPVSAEEVKVIANDRDALGAKPESTYTLQFTKDIEQSEVEKNLVVTPNKPYTVKAKTKKEYLITFGEALNPKEIVKFELNYNPEKVQQNTPNVLSWAFQIKDSFRVIGTLPRNQSLSVPVNTGIEFILNTPEYSDPSNLIETSPKIEAEVKRNGAVISLVPKSLQPGTLYTVKLKSGLSLQNSSDKITTDSIIQFETATEKDRASIINFGQNFYQSTTSSKPSLEILGVFDQSKVKTEVFNFSSLAEFETAIKTKQQTPRWAYNSLNQNKVDTKTLKKIQTADLSITESNYKKFVTLPKELDKGYYLVEVTIGDSTVQAFLQSTNISGFLQEYKDRSFVWIHDLLQKKPIAGAKLTIPQKDIEATSDQSGLAVFNTAKQEIEESFYYKITVGDETLIIPHESPIFSPLIGPSNSVSNDYWSYLYTDKTLYQSNDNINLWGFVQARKGGVTTGLKATLSINNFEDSGAEIFSSDIALSNGQFNSKIPLKSLASGFYDIKIVDSKNNSIITNSIEVKNYIKPSYSIKAEADKKAYFRGEQIKYAGDVSFYDGTPVTNLELIDSDSTNILKTDQFGKFSKTQNITQKGDPSGNGRNNQYITFSPKDSEQTGIVFYGSVAYFDYKSNLNIQTQNIGGKAKVDLTLNEIDLSRINSNTASSPDDFLGKAIDKKSINLAVEEYTYEAIETGTYYDLYTKKTQKTYQYNKKSLGTKNLKTTTRTDGRASVEFATKPDLYYTVNIITTDIDGGQMNFTREIYAQMGQIDQQSTPNLKVIEDRPFKIGEDVNLGFFTNTTPTPTGNNNYFLYYTSQDGLEDVQVSTSNKLNFKYKEDFVPNLEVAGVAFIDGNLYISYPTSIVFDTTDKKLSVSVLTDKTSYRPGDQATLKVNVQDTSKKGVATSVNLSAVDEALYALSNNPASPLSKLYSSINNTVSYKFLTHQYENLNAAGGFGAGGDRTDFVDTALFTNVQTDADGNGSVSFKIPDNITSYKLMAQTITSDLRVGQTEQSIKVSLPFFVDVVTSSTYIVGDSPVLKIRSFGSETKLGTPVSYKISSDTLGISEQTINSKIGESGEYQLKNITAGNHKIKIAATYNNLSDTLIRTFEVKNNYSNKIKVVSNDFSNETNLENNALDSTELTISDGGIGRRFPELTEIANTFGNRLDQLVASQKSRELLNQYFKTSELVSVPDIQTYQTETGGLGIYPYADNDLWTSSLLANLNFSQQDNTKLQLYLESVINNGNESRERKLQALYGLAGLKQPVLNTLQSFTNVQDLNPKEKIYLALGLNSIGDKETARNQFRNIYSNYLKTIDGKLQLSYGQPATEIAQDTVLFAVLASVLNNASDTEIYTAVTQVPDTNPMYLERVLYLNSWLKNQKSEAVEFSYSLNGQDMSKKLNSGEVFKMILNKEQLKNLNLKTISGSLTTTSKFTVALDKAQNSTKDLEISRSYSIVGQTRTDIRDGDLIRIELKYNIKDEVYKGCYRLTDFLPSGLRAETSPQAFIQKTDFTTINYPYEINGQAVSFCASRDGKNSISYLARVVNKGSFTSDRAIIQSYQNPNQLAVSDIQKIDIS